MSKPLGMTSTFQIVHPTPQEDAIWDAVVAAIDGGMTVEQFRSEAASCWTEYLRQRAESDKRAWEPR